MTGLRGWERDRRWPERAGEPELVPPGEDELLALVAAHALRPGARAPVGANWVYARWKPGVSICAAYELLLGDDVAPVLLVVKRYLDDKALALAARALPGDVEGAVDDVDDASPLRPSVVLPEQRMHLWTEGADRELPGLARLSDMRRTKRLLADQGVFAPLRLRSHRSRLLRLRYRPERRAVLRLDAVLRGEQGGALTERLGVRALTPDTAERVARRRRALGCQPGLPELLAAEERTGLLFERWFDGLETYATAQDAEVAAGSALARLHTAAPPAESVLPRAARRASALLTWDPGLAERARMVAAGLGATDAGPPCWVHGDFHLDQLAHCGNAHSPLLLDLDALAPGEAGEDLASWVADRMADEPNLGPGDAACGLLEVYEQAGARAPAFARLAELVADALVERAEGCLRRLEHDARARAEWLLDRAASLSRSEARRS